MEAARISHSLATEGYFMICHTFLESVYYLPHDHHMSVTHKMTNDRSAKKIVANYKIWRHYPIDDIVVGGIGGFYNVEQWHKLAKPMS
jgi:hypothetical protein